MGLDLYFSFNLTILFANIVPATIKVSKSPWNFLCLIKKGILNLKKNLQTRVKFSLIKSSIFFASTGEPNQSWVDKYFEQTCKN